MTVLADSLSDFQALKLEAELIPAFGTEVSGGILTNSVIPFGTINRPPKNVVISAGVREKAQLGLTKLKEAVLEFAQSNPKLITNSEAAKSLGLQCDLPGWIKRLSLLEHYRAAYEGRSVADSQE